jgi:hypothetical protein
MILDDEQTRAAYYTAAEVIRSRQRSGQPIPPWLKQHHALLDAAIRDDESRTRQRGAENGDQGRQSELIGTRQAAELLHLSSREVQRSAADLGGRLVGHGWVFSRDAVIMHARRRDE